MKHSIPVLILLLSFILIAGCGGRRAPQARNEVRQLADTVGFAQYPWQMDSLFARMERAGWQKNDAEPWKLAICPHDDYTYVGSLYPSLLQNVKAPVLILVGVAHKAAKLGIENKLVFDSYKFWKGPWKDVPVSPVREKLVKLLGSGYAMISDTLQSVEHSLEAMIPFFQYFNRDISIVPILVPAMSPERMDECGKALAVALGTIAEENEWEWGSDYAMVVTTDAVHYGNEGWGGSDYALFGCDTIGNLKAREYESEIISRCLTGKISQKNFRLFSSYTLNSDNYKEYKWTWCGRYSIPVALYASWYLNNKQILYGDLTGYSTSITSEHVPVADLGMGSTAIATTCHWVGYAAVGYR